MDEEDYGDIADEDFLDALSPPSQTLPSLPTHARKRRRVSESTNDDEISIGSRRNSRDSIECSGEEGANPKSKKSKYRIHEGAERVAAAQIVGATQAEELPNSSPAYKIRGPIYMKPRPEVPKPHLFAAAPPRQPVAKIAPLFQRQSSNISNSNDNINRNGSGSGSGKGKGNVNIDDFSRELEDLPSDAFSSPETDRRTNEPIEIGSSPIRDSQESSFPRQRLVAPQTGLRQTTLFGGRAAEEAPASQVKKVHNFIVDLPPEAPTHHKLDEEALKTWVYPTNLGTIRDYQFSIVKNALFNNLLVALPTGLGKTFIAATVMLNYFRWTKDAQIVFVAPTKPLVAQQIGACFNIVGIPKSQTTMLTGEQSPPLRAEEWAEKRVFFMTPQTLMNDLSTGIADPKKIVLIVVDEAHRATGNYAYVSVVNFMRRFNKSFRILALTATPGANVEAVQEVIDGLEISKVEIRTEESMDIQQYVHKRNIDKIPLDSSPEIELVQEHLSKVLQPLVNLLCSQRAYYNKDPMALTPFGMLTARKQWMGSPTGRNANMGLKGMMNAIYTVLGSVAHGIKLLNFHGIGPFYSFIKDFRQGVEDQGNKGGKYRKQIIEHPEFKKMMDRVGSWIGKNDFVGHPKLTYLCDTILNHFLDSGEGRLGEDSPLSATRVIVFSEFRDSAEEISRVLNRHGPLVRATVFVGQADSKRSEGMNQAKQLETINNFKSGKVNVIVATSIGEEGLDIGQVDLIVCYDASASPIRMLQRMGRTGRKRAGRVVLLLSRGKEEEAFVKAKDNYEQMQKMISDGARFNFRHDLSVRIVPKSITPVVDKRLIDIPIENTQGPALPEPKRRAGRAKKMPPKKFHMPDDVETGFRRASNLNGEKTILSRVNAIAKKVNGVAKSQLAPVLPVESVLLNKEEREELEQRYQNIAGNDLQEVTMPDMTSHPAVQRSLSRTIKIPHGQYTKRCVELFKTLAKSQDPGDRLFKPYGDIEPSRAYLDPPSLINEGETKAPVAPRKAAVPKAKPPQKQKNALVISDIESDMEESSLPQRHRSSPAADSEGEGDDLAVSEQESEDSDMDPSSSLLNFLAEDDEDNIRMTRPLTKSSSPQPTEAPKRKPSLEPLIHDLDSDEDDLPDVSDLVGGKSRTVSRAQSDGLSSDENVPSKPEHRVKRKRVVEDDDSDE
ncbi:ATP-dependent DNA helicase mph1 [Lachnellula suecica]|uniref:ATP-dependent DNA helicase n=1 Tax=Lachnellula suecica TaxID=602035 RepID=A0A8T9C2X8_9HELO|nr:ATP-dependent DNA helicase mph1 [Lachnellula suecica]